MTSQLVSFQLSDRFLPESELIKYIKAGLQSLRSLSIHSGALMFRVHPRLKKRVRHVDDTPRFFLSHSPPVCRPPEEEDSYPVQLYCSVHGSHSPNETTVGFFLPRGWRGNAVSLGSFAIESS